LGVTPSAWGGSFRSYDVGAYGSFWNTSGGTIGMAYNAYHNGTNFVYKASSIAPANYQQSLGSHAWFTAPSGTAGNAITFTQAMTLDASGNLGIGTTSPSALLHVLSTGDAVARVTSGNANTAVLDLGKTSDTDGGRIAYDSGNNLLLHTASTERVRIGSAGQIGIGGANYGTSGQVLTSGGSGAAPSWASPSRHTLLGTINTTSGTSQTLSGLTLTDYTAMVLEFVDVNVNSSLSNFNLRINSTSGPNISENWSGNTTDGWFGIMTIMLSTGVFSSILAVGATVPTSAQGEVWAGDCNVTTASTSVTIALSNNSFAAGSIRVYGVK
jgi:hypothetical protein